MTLQKHCSIGRSMPIGRRTNSNPTIGEHDEALIKALQQGGYHDEAETLIAAFDSLDDKAAVAQLFREASWLWGQKEFNELEVACEELLERNPNHYAATIYLVDGCLAQGKFSKSLKYALLGAELRPDSHNAHRAVGELQMLAGQIEEGVATLRDVLKKHPKAPMVHSDIAFGLYQLGHRKEAIAECDLGITENPQDMFCRATLARVVALPIEMQGKEE